MKTSFFSKLAIWGFILLIGQVGMSLAATPGRREPLASVQVTQLSTSVLRVRVTLNPLLPAIHEYNMGIFTGGRAVMSNCENYAQFNGCYFPGVTTSSTTTFLLLGNFTEGWHDNKFAIVVVFSAPSPASLSRPGLGPIFTKDFAGIKAPVQSIATTEYFPFGRIPG